LRFKDRVEQRAMPSVVGDKSVAFCGLDDQKFINHGLKAAVEILDSSF
jgi:hypothetical protein